MGAAAQRIARAAIQSGGSQQDEGAVFGKAGGAIAAAVNADSRGRVLISRQTVHWVPVR
jgi:hypothetical protein